MRGIIPHSIVDNVPQRPYAVQRALRMSPRSGQFSPVYPGFAISKLGSGYVIQFT
jgi:hypothetical protein